MPLAGRSVAKFEKDRAQAKRQPGSSGGCEAYQGPSTFVAVALAPAPLAVYSCRDPHAFLEVMLLVRDMRPKLAESGPSLQLHGTYCML